MSFQVDMAPPNAPEQAQITPTLIGAPVACADVDALVDWLLDVGLLDVGLLDVGLVAAGLLELHAAATIDTAAATAMAPAIRRQLGSKSLSKFKEIPPLFLDP